MAHIVASTLGAEIFEFHVTFDKRSFGPDSIASLNIDSARKVANILSSVDLAIKKIKKSSDKKKLANQFGYSLSVRNDKDEGDTIEISDLETKKPAGHGIHPKEYQSIIGRKTLRKILKDES